MIQKKQSLKRTLLIGTVLFIVVLCIALNTANYNSYRRMLYSQYALHIEEILRYVEKDIDADDLAECLRTGTPSEKFRVLQTELGQITERLDVHEIYLIEPAGAGTAETIRSVISGAARQGSDREGDPAGGAYSPKTAKKYLDACRSGELTFFEKISERGDDYTGLLPLRDTRGNLVAALCVDVDVARIHETLRTSLLENIALIVLLGSCFAVFFLIWSGRYITRPIERLERCVVDFASKCRDQKDPESLRIDVPVLRGNSEITTLAEAVSQMSEAMQDYLKGMVTAEKAVRDAETAAEFSASISALLDNIPGMSFSKDAQTGVYLACNQAFAEYARKDSPADVVGLTDADLFDPETARHFVSDDHAALSMDEPYIFFEDVPDAAGNLRQLQTTKLKFVDPTGRLCLLGMCSDVTDTRTQAQANSMITAMAADYRCVYYVNLDENDGVCYRDDPTDPSQTPAGVHFPYLERITWYAENYVTDLYREGFLDFIDPDNIRERLSTQPLIAYRYLAKRGDTEYYEMIRAAGVRRAEERDDHIVHAIGLGLTKIDEEMRETMAKNEALAEALAMAQEANVAKTAFLSNMSHEIRTPMNAILGLNNLALHDETLTPQTREYLEKTGDSARHLLALINDILDMSRIESGRIVLQREEFSFSRMLEQINTMVMSQCEDKGLHYECRILSSVDDYYIGDDMKLKEVLINILSNAIKFTEAPGSVVLTVERTAEYEDHSTLRFRIKDTGIGMDKSFLPKIFDAFSQEDSTRKSKYGSTGLGMAITKSIVEMMNGTISVESEKGVGTEFTVVIPLRNSLRTSITSEDSIDPGSLRVLIVDDEEIVAEHGRLVLDEAGIRADVCHSGPEALNMLELQSLKQEPYNLVLMDWRMPEMDGVETARRIRQHYSSENLAIIMTAYTWDQIREEALAAGIDSFLAKPLFASNVVEEFERVVRRNHMDMFKEKQRAPLAGRRVLLAEDVEINAMIMMDILSLEEMEADHAVNGQAAVEMFEHSAPGTYSAILMDARMPVMDGLEATAAIRALDREDAKRIPIIALTANAFDEDVQRSLQAGMNAHLTKPVETEHLFQTLGELIYEMEHDRS